MDAFIISKWNETFDVLSKHEYRESSNYHNYFIKRRSRYHLQIKRNFETVIHNTYTKGKTIDI